MRQLLAVNMQLLPVDVVKTHGHDTATLTPQIDISLARGA